MQPVAGIRDLVDRYDVFLLDMWGVLHDGSRPFPGVLDAVAQLKAAAAAGEQKKELVILSNSSKRTDNSVRMLTKLGFDPKDFAQIITSGEVAWNMLAGNMKDEWLEATVVASSTTKNVFVLGSGDGDVEYCESCGWTVSPVDEADLILARGTFTVNGGGSSAAGAGAEVVHKNEDAQAYETALEQCLAQAAAKQLPMLVANPDKVRPDKDRPPMPGAIGDAYEAALARAGVAEPEALVKRIGKPLLDVYRLALLRNNDDDHVVDPSRVLMVGDALETDVVGGATAGIHTAWVVLDGIHSPDIAAAAAEDTNLLLESCTRVLKTFNARSNDTYAKGKQLEPDILMPHFRW